jgi:thymidylate synthase
MVGSLHLYDDRAANAKAYLKEGWQHPAAAMPPMPAGDPWADVERLREFETQLREGDKPMPGPADLGTSYWDDLRRVLLGFGVKAGDPTALTPIRESLSDPYFALYLSERQLRHESR